MTLCQICLINSSNYKCPTCLLQYCNLACYKSEKHKEIDMKGKDNDVGNKAVIDKDVLSNSLSEKTTNPLSEGTSNSLFEKILSDPHIQSLLSIDSLQFHLSVLMKLLKNTDNILEPKAINESKQVMNLKLLNLRLGGTEENELVEEFVNRVLVLKNEIERV